MDICERGPFNNKQPYWIMNTYNIVAPSQLSSMTSPWTSPAGSKGSWIMISTRCYWSNQVRGSHSTVLHRTVTYLKSAVEQHGVAGSGDVCSSSIGSYFLHTTVYLCCLIYGRNSEMHSWAQWDAARRALGVFQRDVGRCLEHCAIKIRCFWHIAIQRAWWRYATWILDSE